ncbi:hypothetical protein B0H14DRAFT_2412066 [Mycena olivaceomarginata]|nr:hypothetical protein B0H14DRAFT_2412066 [Mycena olivaceomarginata]
MLEGGELGPDWEKVVEIWWCLEASSKFATSTKAHPTTKRPKAVGVWVKNARKGVPLDIGNMEEEEWGWWKAINPKWRLHDGELLAGEQNGTWDALRCPGQNGFLNVIVCLKWWRSSMETPSDGWTRAVADVTWALEKMILA